jgi:hypothetical protein
MTKTSRAKERIGKTVDLIVLLMLFAVICVASTFEKVEDDERVDENG